MWWLPWYDINEFDKTVIITVKGYDYRSNFWFMTKNDAVDRMKNADLSELMDNYSYEKYNYLL